jgi:hypothetical protein
MHPEEGKNMGTEGATVILATRPVRQGDVRLDPKGSHQGRREGERNGERERNEISMRK